jgi:prepilin-type N-terminal cleavage/methylation domain-containing protein/prepilin-type processing-associated H-X9-DG protein
MLTKAQRRINPGGFTLLELLVTVGVISILVAMLVPPLRTARKQAKQVVCATRLKQWGLAFSLYASNNGEVWPHCDGLDRGPRSLDDPRLSPEDLADWHGWVDVLSPYIGNQPWREHRRGEYPDDTTVYQCPAARLAEGERMYNYRPLRDGYFSYAMNSCLELDSNAWAPPGPSDYPMPSFLNTSKISEPHRVILLFDQLLDPMKGFDAKVVYRGAGKHCGSYPKAFAARHARNLSELGGNILFCDGHVGWQATVWDPDWDPDQEVPPRDSRDWYPYPMPGGG